MMLLGLVVLFMWCGRWSSASSPPKMAALTGN